MPSIKSSVLSSKSEKTITMPRRVIRPANSCSISAIAVRGCGSTFSSSREISANMPKVLLGSMYC